MLEEKSRSKIKGDGTGNLNTNKRVQLKEQVDVSCCCPKAHWAH